MTDMYPDNDVWDKIDELDRLQSKTLKENLGRDNIGFLEERMECGSNKIQISFDIDAEYSDNYLRSLSEKHNYFMSSFVQDGICKVSLIRRPFKQNG